MALSFTATSSMTAAALQNRVLQPTIYTPEEFKLAENWSDGVMSMMNCLYCSKLESYLSILHGCTGMLATLLQEDDFQENGCDIKISKISHRICHLFEHSPAPTAVAASPPASHLEWKTNTAPTTWLVHNIGFSTRWLSYIIRRSKLPFGVVATSLLYLQRIIENCTSLHAKPYIFGEARDVFSDIQFQRRLYRLFVLTLLIIAGKYHQDKHYSNSVWAELSGFSVELINLMERVCLRLLYFDLFVESDVLYYENWLKYWIRYIKFLHPSTRRPLTVKTSDIMGRCRKKKLTSIFSFKK
jgi:hypothetical protein